MGQHGLQGLCSQVLPLGPGAPRDLWKAQEKSHLLEASEKALWWLRWRMGQTWHSVQPGCLDISLGTDHPPDWVAQGA